MNKNILILNGHQYWESAPGELNRALVGIAEKCLKAKGHAVKTTHIDNGYDVEDEIGKMLWAEVAIYQFPVYWFFMPWGMKKYIDEVYSIGRGRIYANDGRTRSDPSRKYGSGGLMTGKSYMMSLTWNAPEEAFTDPAQLFEGKDVDETFFGFHKGQQFVGFEPHLPSFSCHDVRDREDLTPDLKKYEQHLDGLF